MVGIMKEIDKLGRIVRPKEYRDRYNLSDRVEILATKAGVLIRNPKYELIEINTKKFKEDNQKEPQ